METIRSILCLLIIGLILVTQESLNAQQEDRGGFQYTVKYVCGAGDGKIVAKGDYHTAINIINPTGELAVFTKKFAVALPGSPGNITGPGRWN